VGLGPNKLVAKMASEFRKPDGLTLIRPEQLPDLLSPLPVDRLVGVGSRMLRQMRSLGIERIGDLAQTPAKLLERRFGIMGRVLHLAAQGKDYSPVGGGYEENLIKSFGHSLSLRGGSNDLEALSNTLLGLVDAVARRMRKEGYLGRTVILRLRVGYSRGYARAATLGKYTCLPRPIFQVARSLLEREALSGAWEDKITTVGVSVSQLKKAEEGRQLSIWDYLDPREHQLISALDKLYDKYGEGVVTRASLLGTFSLSGMNPAIP
jgi:DNA polymerase-4